MAAGVIVGYVVEKINSGWLLRLAMHSALPEQKPAYLIDYRGLKPRVFSSPATALRNAGEIGFDVTQISGGHQ